MFDKLPDLFSRNFAIGYFLPCAFFVTCVLAIAEVHDKLQDIVLYSHKLGLNTLLGVTVFGLVSWFGGIVLAAINRDLIRFFEGYGTYNPLKLFSWIERRRFFKLKKRTEYMDEGDKRYQKSMIKFTNGFPYHESLLLATSFGNIIRAFESYSVVMYGFDSIVGWPRLQAVVPEEHKELTHDAKAYVDFWINMCFVSVLSVSIYLLSAFLSGNIVLWWVCLSAIALIYVFYGRATSAARIWGEQVKSTFDVFLPRLAEEMGIELPADREKHNQIWLEVSQALLYVRPDLLPEYQATTQKGSDEQD